MAEGTKLRGALGLAMKAGKCASGDFACEKLIKGGGARLVVLDATASASTKARYEGMCARAGVALIETQALGSAIGRPGRMVAVVTHESFAKLIATAHAAGNEQKDTGGIEWQKQK